MDIESVKLVELLGLYCIQNMEAVRQHWQMTRNNNNKRKYQK